jgi:hypothetical protein
MQTAREASISALASDAKWLVSCPVAVCGHF